MTFELNIRRFLDLVVCPPDYKWLIKGEQPRFAYRNLKDGYGVREVLKHTVCTYGMFGTTLDSWNDKSFATGGGKWRGDFELTKYQNQAKAYDAYVGYSKSMGLKEQRAWGENRKIATHSIRKNNELATSYGFSGVFLADRTVLFTRLIFPEKIEKQKPPPRARQTQIKSWFREITKRLDRYVAYPGALELDLEKFDKSELEKSLLLAERIRHLVDPHLATLRAKRAQLITRDSYGNMDIGPWLAEVEYFRDRIVLKGDVFLQKDEEAYLVASITHLVEIESTLSDHRSDADVANMDPLEYEAFCCELLNKNGWAARLTVASGDQGVDIFAEFGNVRAVFQCKKVSRTVGNTAVQEVLGGKEFERAHIAAVVSNAPFTRSARQLAAATNVYLLSHWELSEFAEKIGLVEIQP